MCDMRFLSHQTTYCFTRMLCRPLVNRAARFCHSAAQGGQILAPLEPVRSLLLELAGMEDFEASLVDVSLHNVMVLAIPPRQGLLDMSKGHLGCRSGSRTCLLLSCQSCQEIVVG